MRRINIMLKKTQKGWSFELRDFDNAKQLSGSSLIAAAKSKRFFETPSEIFDSLAFSSRMREHGIILKGK